MSEWEGTAWEGTASVVIAEQPDFTPGPGAYRMKAATGWESIYNPYTVPQALLDRNPLKTMREAQALYWSNPWIGTAEDAVTRKVKGLPWHLEDTDEDTVDDEEKDPVLQAIRSLLEKPQAAIPKDLRQAGIATWADMIGVTSRHMGVCGIGYWYLDAQDANGIPQALLYVNPARLYPHVSGSGNLLGYSLDPKDAQGRGGTPLRRDEIVPFYLRPPDWGALPKGLVERAALKGRITQMVDSHSAYVLGSGGRIAGIVAPKDGYITDQTIFDQLVADFRNVNEAADAAKRTTILRGPVEFHETASNPTDLSLLDIGKVNRDDILAIWNCPPSQAGVGGQTVGLNSGETRRYEYQILMQGPVHDRVDTIRQTIQLELLDRWNALGKNPQLVIEEPDFDDDAAPYELAQKAREQPLTNNERRALVNLDPLPDYGPDGEPLGLAIILPTVLSAWGQGGEPGAAKGSEFKNAPTEAEQQPVTPPVPPALDPVPLPAKAGGFQSLRKSMDERVVPAMRKSVQSVLRAQRDSIVAKVRTRGEALVKRPATAEKLWDGPTEDVRMAKALKPHVAGIASTVTERSATLLRAKADPFEEAVEQELLKRTGQRIHGINETTRDAVVAAIRQGVEDGLTADAIADLLQDLPAFDEARAELVARTETGYAYNAAAVSSYREYGVERVTVLDGDEDDICAAVNGKVWTLDEAFDNPLGHPHCQRDFAPMLA